MQINGDISDTNLKVGLWELNELLYSKFLE